jgi:hypothetical protein
MIVLFYWVFRLCLLPSVPRVLNWIELFHLCFMVSDGVIIFLMRYKLTSLAGLPLWIVSLGTSLNISGCGN